RPVGPGGGATAGVRARLRTSPTTGRHRRRRRALAAPLRRRGGRLPHVARADGRVAVAADDDPTRRQVPPGLQLAAAYAWRRIVVAIVVAGAVWLLGELWVVVLALVVSTFLARALDPPVRWLRSPGVPA